MKPELDNAWLKVIWAQERLDALKDGVRAHLDDRATYQSVIDVDGDRINVTRPVIKQPPIHLGRFVSECVYHSMTALDYVIWALADKFVGRTLKPPPDGDDAPSFPLYRDANKYLANPGRFTKYKFPADVVNVITTVQPYNRGYESLFVLYHLVNQDKHRLPVLTETEQDVDEWRVRIFRLSQGLFTNLGSASITGSQTLSISTSQNSLGPDDSIDVDVKTDLSVFVTLPYLTMPPEPIDVTLQQIINTVMDVVPRFDRFF